MKKILVLGDFNADTGFGTVLKNIINQTRRYSPNDYLINILAINYYGPPFQLGDNIRVRSAKLSMPDKSLQDNFGKHAFIQELTDAASGQPGEQPYDGIFIIQDPGHINGLVPSLKPLKKDFKNRGIKQFKSIVYFPIDHDNTPVNVYDRIDFYDEIVCYNYYGKKQVLANFPNWKNKISVLSHGINTSDFFPLPSSQSIDFRREYFGDNAEKYIVLNLNRNQPRKDIPSTIFAFKEFQKTNPDAFLYLHMHPMDPLGWKLHQVMNQAGLLEGKDYMFPPAQLLQQPGGIPVSFVNFIYNACDVYITTTHGEGWGLTVTEAMACKLPVICPLHTSFIEITDNGRRATVLENMYPECRESDSTIRDQCDFIEAAEALQKVRNDRDDIIKTKVELAYQYAQTLDWNKLGKQWIKLFKQVY